MEKTIFVHIAAYRDPELVPTVLDCIKNASKPERLRFGICWQYADGENIDAIRSLPNVRIDALPATESKGACWARARAQKLYNGEDYYLQLDSHHRFVEKWDEQMQTMLEDLKKNTSEKPVLTTYPPAYEPLTDPVGRATGAVQLDFNHFSDATVFTVGSSGIKNHEQMNHPVRARFLAAGFIFAPGSFVTEVPYDPYLYFQGEEMSLALRAFTHGFDLFHPHKLLCWHHYIRKNASRHWNDHKAETTDKAEGWAKFNEESYRRVKTLFGVKGYPYEAIKWGPYGLGTQRTVKDYERFCGFDVNAKRITKQCLDKRPPEFAPPISDERWKSMLLTQYEHTVEINGDYFQYDDYDFIYVGFDRKDGTNIYCTNITQETLATLLKQAANKEAIMPLRSTFFCDDYPHRWCIWPHSKSKGWVHRLSGVAPTLVGS